MVPGRFSCAWLGIGATLILSVCSSNTAKVPDASKTPDAGPTVTSSDGGSGSTPSLAQRDGGDSGVDERLSDRPSGALDGGGSPDGSADAIKVTDAGCTVASGDPCSNLGETCSRDSGCCVCASDNAAPSTPRWLCVQPQKAGVCSSFSWAPSINSSCSPATMVCPFCVDGSPQCFYCAIDQIVTGHYYWMQTSVASCK
jgi:hypothetical protein